MEEVVAMENGFMMVSPVPPTTALVPESVMPLPAVGVVVATDESALVLLP